MIVVLMYVGVHCCICVRYRAVVPNQGSAEHRTGFREKSWNIYEYIKKFWNFEILRKISNIPERQKKKALIFLLQYKPSCV